MDLIVTLLVGALIGWIASLIVGTDADMGALANIVVGIVGAWLGRFIFSDVLQIGGAVTAGTFSFAGILWGILGAVVLLGILKAFYRSTHTTV